MQRRIASFTTIAAIAVMALAVIRPATSEDNYAPRIAGLEARVAALETQVATKATIEPLPTVARTFTLSGTVTIWRRFDRTGLGDHCTGDGPYINYREGMPISILDQSGNIIASDTLWAGTVYLESTRGGCRFPFAIHDIPVIDIYQIQFGSTPPITVTFSQIQKDKYKQTYEVGA